MTEKHCVECTNVKLYDGIYRCMTCYKQFIEATKEDVMNSVNVAPAIERIKELENENSILKQTIESMKQILRAMYNKEPSTDVPGVQCGGTG